MKRGKKKVKRISKSVNIFVPLVRMRHSGAHGKTEKATRRKDKVAFMKKVKLL